MKIMSLTSNFSIKYKLMLELIPLIIVALLFIPLLSYTMNSKIIGDIKYENYYKILNEYFENKAYESKDDILKALRDIEIEDETIFIIDEEEKYQTLNNNKLSNFFVKYTIQNEENNRTYDYYCIDNQGTFIKVYLTTGENYLVGLMYSTASETFSFMLVISVICLMFIILIILWYISNSLAKDIEQVKEGLNKIIEENDLNYKLIVTSKDEIGELTESFNEVQQLTKKHIEDIKEKQDLILRQGKLSILGEMAGGMAHDINNPASAINMSINCLYDIDNQEEKKAILDNMKECIKRILSIVSSVRDQFRNFGATHKESFTIYSVLENVKIVINNQLQKYNCGLNITCDNTFKVFGEKNKLNQVISNIVMNSLLAYKEIDKTGSIDIEVSEQEKWYVLSIRDEAGGISEKVKDTIFKEILTTRGTQGTGLGLYLAKSIIEDDFNGQIYFETVHNKGTTFYIKLLKMEE